LLFIRIASLLTFQQIDMTTTLEAEQWRDYVKRFRASDRPVPSTVSLAALPAFNPGYREQPFSLPASTTTRPSGDFYSRTFRSSGLPPVTIRPTFHEANRAFGRPGYHRAEPSVAGVMDQRHHTADNSAWHAAREAAIARNARATLLLRYPDLGTR